MVESEAPKPAPRRKPIPERILTYELGFDDGKVIRLDIPSSFKVTFGPIAGIKGYEGGGMAFRAWEAETRQRVLYRGVAWFRDVSLPLQMRAVRRFGSDVWFPDDGTWINEKRDLVQFAWKPVDEMADRDPAETVNPEKADDDDDDPFGTPKRLTGMHPRANRRI